MKRNTLSALLALFLLGCDAGNDEAPALDAGNADSLPSYQALPDTVPGVANCAEPVPVTIIGGVPFGPAPRDVSRCQGNVGCILTFTPDRKGCYCEYICTDSN